MACLRQHRKINKRIGHIPDEAPVEEPASPSPVLQRSDILYTTNLHAGFCHVTVRRARRYAATISARWSSPGCDGEICCSTRAIGLWRMGCEWLPQIPTIGVSLQRRLSCRSQVSHRRRHADPRRDANRLRSAPIRRFPRRRNLRAAASGRHCSSRVGSLAIPAGRLSSTHVRHAVR